MTKSCKAEAEEYKRPEVKFASETNQKVYQSEHFFRTLLSLFIQADYQAIDVRQAYIPPAKPPAERRARPQEKMESCSTTRHFYQKWEVPPPVRYGDFHESHSYVPSMAKFEGSAMTASTFKGQSAPIPPRILPKDQLHTGEGGFDFNTMYKSSFKQPNVLQNLTKAQARLLLEELKQRKAALQATQPPRVAAQL
jgi:hypothetical protein